MTLLTTDTPFSYNGRGCRVPTINENDGLPSLMGYYVLSSVAVQERKTQEAQVSVKLLDPGYVCNVPCSKNGPRSSGMHFPNLASIRAKHN